MQNYIISRKRETAESATDSVVIRIRRSLKTSERGETDGEPEEEELGYNRGVLCCGMCGVIWRIVVHIPGYSGADNGQADKGKTFR